MDFLLFFMILLCFLYVFLVDKLYEKNIKKINKQIRRLGVMYERITKSKQVRRNK